MESLFQGQGQGPDSEVKEQNSAQPPAAPRVVTPPRFNPAKKLEEALYHEAQLKEKSDSMNEWQTRIQKMDQVIVNNEKEKQLLAERVRQSEERNVALANQFNELYNYCESLYKDSDIRRKAIEARCAEAEQTVVELKAQIERAEISNEGLFAENVDFQTQIMELKQTIKGGLDYRSTSLSSLVRGKECIDSAVRMLQGFQDSFQAYLESIEKNGFTPVSQRTGRLFLEHWNVERENVTRATSLLTELFETSKDTQS